MPSGNPSKLHQIDQIRFAKHEFPLKRLFPGVLYLAPHSPLHCLLRFVLICPIQSSALTGGGSQLSPGVLASARDPGVLHEKLHITIANLSELLHFQVTQKLFSDYYLILGIY